MSPLLLVGEVTCGSNGEGLAIDLGPREQLRTCSLGPKRPFGIGSVMSS